MRNSLRFLAALALLASPAAAQVGPGNSAPAKVVATCAAQSYTAGSQSQLTIDTTGNLCTGGTISATIAGFAPTGSYAQLPVSNSSSNVALPTGSTIIVYNTGSNTAYVNLGSNSVTATTGNNAIPAGGWMAFAVGANTYLAAITSSSTTSLNIAGGSGIPTGSGGGGGGSGGTVVGQGTANSPSGGVLSVQTPQLVTTGTITTYNQNPTGTATAGSAVTVNFNSLSTMAVTVSGTWSGSTLSLQFLGDCTNSAWITKTSTSSFFRRSTGVYSATIPAGASDTFMADDSGYCQARITALGAGFTGTANISIVQSEGHEQPRVGPLAAGANIIGKVGIDQTTPGTTNGVQINAALPAGTNVIGGVTTPLATPVTGQIKIAVTGTAVALGSAVLTSGVIVKASSSNAATIYVGPAGVTNTGGGTGNGYPLAPGESMSFASPNLSSVYVNGTAGDYVSFGGS